MMRILLILLVICGCNRKSPTPDGTTIGTWRLAPDKWIREIQGSSAPHKLTLVGAPTQQTVRLRSPEGARISCDLVLQKLEVEGQPRSAPTEITCKSLASAGAELSATFDEQPTPLRFGSAAEAAYLVRMQFHVGNTATYLADLDGAGAAHIAAPGRDTSAKVLVVE